MGAPNPDVSSPISQANKDPKVQKPNASTATVCILINIINNNTSNISNNNNDRNNRSPTKLRKFKSDIYILHTLLVYTCAPKRVWTTVRTETKATYGQPSVLKRVRTAVRTRALAYEIFVVRPCSFQIEAREPASSFCNLPAPLESTT